jgi:hypothetical protein
VAGVPAKIKRTGLSAGFTENPVKTYIETSQAHRSGLRRLDAPSAPTNPTNTTSLGGLGWPVGVDIPPGASRPGDSA